MNGKPHYYAVLFALSLLVGAFLAGYSSFLNFQARQSIASQPAVVFTISPTSLTVDPNQTKTADIIIQPQDSGNTISGIDLIVHASGQAAIEDISAPSVFATGDTTIFTPVISSVTAQTGRISYVITRTSSDLPTAIKITLTVRGMANGTGEVTIDSAASQIVGQIVNYQYSIAPISAIPVTVGSGQSTQPSPTSEISPSAAVQVSAVPTATPTYTPQNADPNAVKLLFKVRFQGIVHDPITSKRSLKTKVSIGKTGSTQEAKYRMDLSYLDEGVWTGSLNINEPPGSGYYVLLKGPFHIKKKICDQNPAGGSQIYACASPNLVFNAGDNSIDLSNIVLSAGDIAPAGGNQDGVLNGDDVLYIKNRLGSSAKDDLDTADINLDGVIDTQDYALIIETLLNRPSTDD